MLNEIREYRIYLNVNKARHLFRKDQLKDQLSGLRRPLTVLARGFLDLCNRENLPREVAVSYCRKFLQVWLGTESARCAAQLPAAIQDEFRRAEDNNFPKITERIISDSQLTAKSVDNIRAAIVQKQETLFYSPCRFYKLNPKNDANRIYGDQIIADAIHIGPLRQQYFALRDPEIAFEMIQDPFTRKCCRAIICWYLMEKQADQQYTTITMAEIANWVDSAVSSKGCNENSAKRKRCLSDIFKDPNLLYHNKPLLYKYQLMSNTIKLTVNCQWLADFDVCLITREQLQAYKDKHYTIYEDSLEGIDKGMRLYNQPKS